MTQSVFAFLGPFCPAGVCCNESGCVPSVRVNERWTLTLCNNLCLASGMMSVVIQIKVHLHFNTHNIHMSHHCVSVCCPSFSCGHPDETRVLSEEILDSQQTGTHA